MMAYYSYSYLLQAWMCMLVHFVFSRAVNSVELRYALFTAGPTGSFDSSGAVPAIELAEEMINAESSILPGYNLTHTAVFDTMCDRTTSLKHYFTAVSSPNPTILGVLGCGCSPATFPVAEIVHYNSISQISYISAAIELDDRRRFPHFFRTILSIADIIPEVSTIIQYYGWKQIAFITQDEDFFKEIVKAEIKLLTMQGIKSINKVIPSEAPKGGFTESELNLFSERDDYRIIFINAYSNLARKIICFAYLRGLTYPRYVWLTYNWFQENSWITEENSEPIDCSNDQLAEFLQSLLLFELFPRNEAELDTAAGLTSGEFDSLYRSRAKLDTPHASYTFTLNFIAPMAYDALWTLALALNKTNEMVQSLTREEILNVTECEGSDKDTGKVWKIVELEKFTYSNQLMGCLVKWNLEKTNFNGISGNVSFNSNGSRRKYTIKFYQFRLSPNGTLSKTLFAYTASESNDSVATLVYVEGEGNDTVFPHGIPSDGTPVNEINTFSLSLVIVVYILAFAGLVFTTFCLLFNFTQRSKKVIKLTSPNINYFVIVGAYLIYLSIFFRVLPSTNLAIFSTKCIITSVLGKSGYMLGYAAILGKMGRIYYIFHNPTVTRKKTFKDWKVILMILGISGCGVLLVVIQILPPQLRPTPALIQNAEYGNNSRNELGIRINHLAYICYSRTNIPQSAWLGVVYAYLAILQVIGTILAIQTRKVKIKVLNDSKYVAAQIYFSSIALLLLIVVMFTLESYPSVSEGIISVGLLTGTTMFLALVFVPKFVSLYRDPHGERVLNTSAHGTTSCACTLDGEIDSNTVTQLQSKIAELESMLLERENGQAIGRSPRQNLYPASSKTSAKLYKDLWLEKENGSVDNPGS